MKRPMEDTSLDTYDLQGQIRALVTFSLTACSSEKYGDDFYIYIDSDNTNKLNLRFRWYYKKFYLTSGDCDSRNHEELLRNHFKHFNLTINKMSYCWTVSVSTPDKPLGEHRVIL